MSPQPDADTSTHVDTPHAQPAQQPHYVLVPFELLRPAAEAAAVHQLVALAARLHDMRRS